MDALRTVEGMSAQVVDVVVIGLGPGGEHLAGELARAGLDVVGVERRLVGGECPYYGCIPSKMMIRAAATLAEARRVAGLAGSAEVTPDWDVVARRIRDEATDDWNDEVAVRRLVDAGVRVLRGSGRLSGPGEVVVDTDDGQGPQRFTARRGVVLNTGTEPSVPPIEGLAGTPYWTNREAVRVTDLPASLIVVGGGAIGLEMAQAFARFGSEVTVLEAGERILGPEEPEAADVVRTALIADGITVREGVAIDRVTHAAGRFTVDLADTQVSAAHLLIAAGRRANLAGLGLDSVGLGSEAESARSLEVDDRMRAGERLWAIGDITGKGAFTHVSMYQADLALADLLQGPDQVDGADGGTPRADYRALSRVTFTDPEVGAVGLTKAQARSAGHDVVTATTDLAASSRGWLHGPGPDGAANSGVVKLVADRERGILLGATTAGPSGGEMIGLLTTAVHAEVPIATLARMHFAYPTFHRAISTALAELAT